jgi:hypothetical protein
MRSREGRKVEAGGRREEGGGWRWRWRVEDGG